MTGTGPAEPAVTRQRLGAELRRLREARSLRLDDVAERVGVVSSTLSRIENGKAPARASYVAVMLDLYGVADAGQRELLTGLAREGQRKSWWADAADLLDPEAGRYLDLESSARQVRSYSALTVPGLLQTADYTEAALRATRPELAGVQVRALVSVQMRRQEVARGHQLHLILDESVLLRAIGSARVMAAQLTRLHAAAAEPAVTIQVIELASARPVVGPSFAVLNLGGEDTDAACTPGIGGRVLFARTRADVRAADAMFAALARAPMSPGDSVSLIEKVAAQWRQEGRD